MLKTIYGTARADSVGHLFESVRANIKNGIKSYLLVPEQFSVFTERKVIETLGVRAQTLVEVLTFSRLSNLVLSSLGPLRLRYIDGAGREILAGRALQLIEGKLQYFKSNVHQRGFSSLMVGLVSEFKRYGLSSESLQNVSAKVEKDEFKRKLEDLALFYDTYSRLINENNSDAEDNLSIILPKIKDFEIETESCLFITEFKSFTPLECQVLQELMKKMSSTVLFLRCDDPVHPDSIFSSASLTYKQLSEAAEAGGIAVGKPESLPLKDGGKPDLIYLQENFYNINPEKYAGTPENIFIYSPENYFDEVEQTAAIIHRLCRIKGYKQSDFLILARDTDVYSRIMPLVFDKLDINVFLDRRRSILENPYLRCVSSMLEILAYGFSYDRVMEIGRSGFAGVSDEEELDVFENYLLSVNPSHAMWNDEGEWTYNPDKRAYDIDSINRIKSMILAPVFEFRHSIKGRKKASEIIEAVFKYMESCRHQEIMRDICKNYSDKGMIYLAEEYRRTWNSVVSVLDRIGEIMGGELVTYEKFYDLFMSACGGIKIGISPQTIDGVVFSKIDMFRNTDAKVVIVLGTTDGVFPRGYGNEGILTDAERETLRTYGIGLAMTATEKSHDEQLLVYNVLSSPSDELYLLYPKSSDNGETLYPSKIITKIENELFEMKKEISNEVGNEMPEGKEPVFLALESEFIRCGGDISLFAPNWRAVYDYFAEDERYSVWLSDFAERLKSAESGYEILSKNSVAKLYGREIMLSASKMEKYNSCAFSYFMRYGLLAKPRDIAVFDPLSMGDILHKSLERFFSSKSDSDYELMTREHCEKEMRNIVSEIAMGNDEVMYKNSAYYKYLVMRMTGIASTTAWETVKFFRESEFRPYGFEIRIGENGDIPPLKVETKNGTAKIEGFIDRADSAIIGRKRYISVVDYKSSAKKLDKELADAGVRFQPLVYTNAVCEQSETEPAAMLYLQMNDPIIDESKAATDEAFETEVHRNVSANGWVVDDGEVNKAFDKNYGSKKCYMSPRCGIPPDEMQKRLKRAEEKIVESAEGILAGEISVSPYKKRGFDPCAYCDYGGICGKNNI